MYVIHVSLSKISTPHYTFNYVITVVVPFMLITSARYMRYNILLTLELTGLVIDDLTL